MKGRKFSWEMCHLSIWLRRPWFIEMKGRAMFRCRTRRMKRFISRLPSKVKTILASCDNVATMVDQMSEKESQRDTKRSKSESKISMRNSSLIKRKILPIGSSRIRKTKRRKLVNFRNSLVKIFPRKTKKWKRREICSRSDSVQKIKIGSFPSLKVWSTTDEIELCGNWSTAEGKRDCRQLDENVHFCFYSAFHFGEIVLNWIEDFSRRDFHFDESETLWFVGSASRLVDRWIKFSCVRIRWSRPIGSTDFVVRFERSKVFLWPNLFDKFRLALLEFSASIDSVFPSAEK